MTIQDRPYRTRKPGSWGKLIWYVILLIIVLILMWKMDAIVMRLPF